MVEVLVRAYARRSGPIVLGAACLALFLLGVVGSAWASPGVVDRQASSGAGSATVSGGDPGGYTAASEDLPLGTKLVVTYKGGSVVVSVDGRGPLEQGVDLDLSEAAAKEIGLAPDGTATVEVMIANPEATVGPLPVTVRGGSMSSTSTGAAQQIRVSSRNNSVTMSVNGTKIVTDSKPVEMVATSTGAMHGFTREAQQYSGGQYGTSQYGTSQYDEYQYDGSQYDGSQYGQAQYGEDQTVLAQEGPGDDTGKAQYNASGARGARSEVKANDNTQNQPAAVDFASDETAGSKEVASSTAGSKEVASSEQQVSGSASGTEEASVGSRDGSNAGKGIGARKVVAGPKQLPETGGVPLLAGAFWVGLISIGLGGVLIRETFR